MKKLFLAQNVASLIISCYHKWNVMPLLWAGGGSYFFEAFCVPDLDKMPVLHSLHRREAIAGYFDQGG